jgi:transcriptional regulator with XRE-family HTH domain
MELGDKITHYRKLQRMTQGQLAEKLGVRAPHISRWENNKVKPNSSALESLAEALGVSLSELVSEPQPQLNGSSSAHFLNAIERLDEDDREVVKRVIEGLLTRKRVQAALEIV